MATGGEIVRPNANRSYVIVPDANASRVLLRAVSGGWTLPPIELPDVPRWWASAGCVRREVRRTLSLDATVLRCLDIRPDQVSGQRAAFFFMEPQQLDWARSAGTDWFGAEDLASLDGLDPDHADVLTRYFSRAPDSEAELRPWTRPRWFNSAISWLETEFMRLEWTPAGSVEQIWSSPWSCVLSVPSKGTRLALKVCSESHAHEPELTQALAQDFPDLVPSVHALDAKRRFLLMDQLEAEPDVSAAAGQPEAAWAETLVRTLVAMQTTYAGAPERLLDLGCPDRSPEILLQELEELFSLVSSGQHPGALVEKEIVQRLGGALDRYRAGLTTLATSEVPASLGHPALVADHVRSGAHGARTLSWNGELTHPFFTLTTLLDELTSVELRAHLREIYLAGWLDWARLPRLVELFELARELGLLARALGQLARLRGLYTHWEREVERADLMATLDRLDAFRS